MPKSQKMAHIIPSLSYEAMRICDAMLISIDRHRIRVNPRKSIVLLAPTAPAFQDPAAGCSDQFGGQDDERHDHKKWHQAPAEMQGKAHQTKNRS